ncbi:hypothetical protein DFH11DRAFT_1639173 [Phellopilus nigrolimitatus]|nr:hypothetical protein DFH11DRAFT_1651553 [Phellopilus nigrolimitatus]KAH8106615.1 hypothetical protein DFH11DRAFT_1639173 [Phellopilus nigrolimitatus]
MPELNARAQGIPFSCEQLSGGSSHSKKGNGDRLESRYSDTYPKKLDLPPGSRSPTLPCLPRLRPAQPEHQVLVIRSAEVVRFPSLADMKWGEFAMFGFGKGCAAPRTAVRRHR